jgi:hypothetical protein
MWYIQLPLSGLGYLTACVPETVSAKANMAL